MSIDRIAPAVEDLARQITVSAILLEAGRLADNDSTSSNTITDTHIMKALDTYLEILKAFQK